MKEDNNARTEKDQVKEKVNKEEVKDVTEEYCGQLSDDEMEAVAGGGKAYCQTKVSETDGDGSPSVL